MKLESAKDLTVYVKAYTLAMRIFEFSKWHGSKLGNSLMCHSEERSDEESQASGNRRIEIPHFRRRSRSYGGQVVRNDMAHVLYYTGMF